MQRRRPALLGCRGSGTESVHRVIVQGALRRSGRHATNPVSRVRSSVFAVSDADPVRPGGSFDLSPLPTEDLKRAAVTARAATAGLQSGEWRAP
jgi:hypothetical protein